MPENLEPSYSDEYEPVRTMNILIKETLSRAASAWFQGSHAVFQTASCSFKQRCRVFQTHSYTNIHTHMSPRPPPTPHSCWSLVNQCHGKSEVGCVWGVGGVDITSSSGHLEASLCCWVERSQVIRATASTFACASPASPFIGTLLAANLGNLCLNWHTPEESHYDANQPCREFTGGDIMWCLCGRVPNCCCPFCFLLSRSCCCFSAFW